MKSQEGREGRREKDPEASSEHVSKLVKPLYTTRKSEPNGNGQVRENTLN